MAKLTNYARGPRGITLKDGTTVWLDPGQSADIKKEDVAGPLPDLGSAPKADETDDGELDSLKSQVADLTKQVAALTKDKADLTKQVEALTAPKK